MPAMRTAALALSVLLLVAAHAVAADARAEKKRVAVTANIINRPENDTELGAIAPYEEAVAAVSYAIALSVVSSSELLESGLGDQLRDCGADIRCISARLRNAGVELALLVVADLGLKPALVTARVVDANKGQVVSTAIAELGVEGLARAVKNGVTRSLERAGVTIGGRVIIETAPPNALVAVGAHEPTAAVASAAVLAPGEYPVRAAQDGFVETSTRAVVRAGRDTRVYLALKPSESVLGSPWLWVAIAGVAAAAGGTIFFLARRPEDLRPLCMSRSDACE